MRGPTATAPRPLVRPSYICATPSPPFHIVDRWTYTIREAAEAAERRRWQELRETAAAAERKAAEEGRRRRRAADLSRSLRVVLKRMVRQVIAAIVDPSGVYSRCAPIGPPGNASGVWSLPLIQARQPPHPGA